MVLRELGWTLTVHPDVTSQVRSPQPQARHPAPGETPARKTGHVTLTGRQAIRTRYFSSFQAAAPV